MRGIHHTIGPVVLISVLAISCDGPTAPARRPLKIWTRPPLRSISPAKGPPS